MLPKNKTVSSFAKLLCGFAIILACSPSARAVTISFVGVEPGSAGSGYATQNWSNAGVSKSYDLSGDVYGTSGYYQIRPIAYPSGSTIYSGAGAGNDLGITAGSNPTLYSAPAFLSSITGGAGDYVNFTNYSIFRGPDGSSLYTQGGLSVPVPSNQGGPYNTPSGNNSGYFGSAFSFTMGPNMGASFRIGVAVDTVASGTYAPDYVSIYNGGTGSVYSSLLTRDGTPDMAVFDVTAAAGDSFSAALWQLANTQSAAAFGLITLDVSSYNMDVTSGAQTNSSVLNGAPAALLKTGAGTTVLTGVSTYQGATTISNGAVEVGGSGQLASGSYGGAVSLATNASSLRVNTSANQTLSGAISGTGSLAKSANGTLTLNGSNSYSGGTTISGGRVLATSTNALGDAAAAITVSGGAYLDLRTNITRTGTVTFNGGYLSTDNGTPSAMTNNGGSYVLTNAAEIVAVLGGTAGLTSGGTGTSILWRSNTYTGATVVSGGTLKLDGSGGVSSSTTVQVDSGATFSTTGLFLTSNNVTVAGLTGAGTVTGGAGTLTLNLAAATNAFSGAITGGIGLTKTSDGTIALNGSNAYTGTTTINAGRIVAANNNALGATNGGTVVASGAQLMLSNNVTIGNEALNISGIGLASGGNVAGAVRNIGTNIYQGKITLGADARIFGNSGNLLTVDVASGDAVDLSSFTLNIDGAGNNRINDAIAGTGGILKTGAGTTTLAASNGYTGATTLNAGRITLSGAGRLGSGAITISNASSGTLELAVTGTNIMANDISGVGAIVSSSGETRFTGAVTTTGGLTNSSSTVRIGNGGTTGSYSGNTVLSDAAAQLIFDRSDAYTHGGSISGSGSVTKLSGGTTTLTASNSYAGGTLISGGTLELGSGGSVVGNITNNAGLRIRTDLTNIVSGTGSLTKATGATASLWNSNTYTGATVVEAGQLRLDGAGAISSSSVVQVASGASFSATGIFKTSNNLTVAGLTGAGTFYNAAGTLTVNQASGSDTFSGTISGGTALTKSGAGSWTLSGDNSYSGGTLLNGGWLVAGHINAFGTGSITVGSGTTLNLTNFVVANQIVNNGGTVLSTGQLSDVTATNGTTDIGGNNSTVTEVGGSATVNISGSSVTVNQASGGTLNISGSDARVAALSGGTVNANAAGLIVTNFNGGNIAVSNGLTVALRAGSSAGQISGSGGVVKQSSDTLTLTANNTYTGATTVEAGKLVVNGSLVSATTVQSGATLGGSGTLASATIESGGTIGPGNSPGTLTLTNGLTWAGGGNYNWQIFNVAGTAGQTNTWDLISVTGGTWDITGLSSTNKFNINLWSLSGLPDTTGLATGFDATQNYSWKILESVGLTGSFSTNLFTINTSAVNGAGGFVGATGLFSLALDGNNDLFLSYAGAGAAVPEPGTWAAGGVLLVLAVVARRRAKTRLQKNA